MGRRLIGVPRVELLRIFSTLYCQSKLVDQPFHRTTLFRAFAYLFINDCFTKANVHLVSQSILYREKLMSLGLYIDLSFATLLISSYSKNEARLMNR
jgi:hypothetical protein